MAVIIFVLIAIAGATTLLVIKKNASRRAEEAARMEREAPENKEGSKEDNTVMEKESEATMREGAATSTKDVIEKKEEPKLLFTGKLLAGSSSPLLEFNTADYDAALRTNKLVVLYFYATWCPICKAEVPKLEAAFNELTNDKVIGFRVNFNDSDTDNDEKNLAREFGVAYQHTKVFIKNGQRVLKSPETWEKEKYLEEINRFAP